MRKPTRHLSEELARVVKTVTEGMTLEKIAEHANYTVSRETARNLLHGEVARKQTVSYFGIAFGDKLLEHYGPQIGNRSPQDWLASIAGFAEDEQAKPLSKLEELLTRVAEAAAVRALELSEEGTPTFKHLQRKAKRTLEEHFLESPMDEQSALIEKLLALRPHCEAVVRAQGEQADGD